MANNLQYAAIFQSELDKAAKEQATSGWMELNDKLVKYNSGSEVKIPMLDMDGLADYDRQTGFVEGSVDLTWQTRKMTMDRGRQFTFDEQEVNDTNFVLTASSAMGEFQRTKVISEIDAYRYSNLADVYNAIHAIQDNLGVAGTTAKEAGETFSGSFSAMKAAAQNLLGNMAIGGDVTGSMKQLVDSASTFLFDNAVPMVGRVIASLPGAIKSAIKSASSKIKASGGGIVESLKAGMISILPSSMGGLVNSLFDTIGNLGSGFTALLPQLQAFGSSVMASVQQMAVAALPVISSIISTVQTAIPAVLPVLETVITNISSIIAATAPIISGLVTGIGTVVSALAPVFQVIFDGIGQKVSSTLEFVGSKMGWIQKVIGAAAPVIADVLTTAWGVISPIMDMAISVFKLLFNVTKTVFNGIASVASNVWEKIRPIVESVAGGLSWVSDKVSGLLGGSVSSSSADVGKNAEGTNNWRGGPTWVGERGPELVDLPKGSRVLPNRESVQLAQSAAQPVVREIVQDTTVEKPVVREVIQNTVEKPVLQEIAHNTVEKPSIYTAEDNSSPVLERIEKGLGVIARLIGDGSQREQNRVSPAPVVREIVQSTVEKPLSNTADNYAGPLLVGTEKGLSVIARLMAQDNQRGQDKYAPANPPKRPDNGQDFPPPPVPDPEAPQPTAAAQTLIQVTLAKLADQIVVREDADIDRIGEAVAKRVVEAARNMVPV